MLEARRGILAIFSFVAWLAPVAAASPTHAGDPSSTARAELYSVQVGAFSARANAEKVAADIERIPADATVAASSSDGRTVYRVLSGVFETRAAADEHADMLAARGFHTYVRAMGASDGSPRGASAADVEQPASNDSVARRSADRSASEKPAPGPVQASSSSGVASRERQKAAAAVPSLAASPVSSARPEAAGAVSGDVAEGMAGSGSEDSRSRALKLLVDSIESGRKSALAAGLADDPAP